MSREEDKKIAGQHQIPIQPVGPRFIGLYSEKDDVTDGGILLPQKAQDNEQVVQPEAIVIRLSKALEQDEKVEIAQGSRVLLNPTARPQVFRHMGQDYLMIDWATVKGIYE